MKNTIDIKNSSTENPPLKQIEIKDSSFKINLTAIVRVNNSIKNIPERYYASSLGYLYFSEGSTYDEVIINFITGLKATLELRLKLEGEIDASLVGGYSRSDDVKMFYLAMRSGLNFSRVAEFDITNGNKTLTICVQFILDSLIKLKHVSNGEYAYRTVVVYYSHEYGEVSKNYPSSEYGHSSVNDIIVMFINNVLKVHSSKDYSLNIDYQARVATVSLFNLLKSNNEISKTVKLTYDIVVGDK